MQNKAPSRFHAIELCCELGTMRSFVIGSDCYNRSAFLLSNHSPWDLPLITFLWRCDNWALKGAACLKLPSFTHSFNSNLCKTTHKIFQYKTTTGSEEEKIVEPKNRPSPAEFLSYEPDLKYPAVVWLWGETSIYESLAESPYYCVVDSAKATKHPSKCLLSVFRTFSLYI